MNENREPGQETRNLSLEKAANAVRTLLRLIEVAQDMKTALATGAILDGVLQEADGLLQVVERELQGLDRARHPTLFAAAPLLRRKLELLSDERCGRSIS